VHTNTHMRACAFVQGDRCCPIVSKTGLYRLLFVKPSNPEFHENPSRDCRTSDKHGETNECILYGNVQSEDWIHVGRSNLEDDGITFVRNVHRHGVTVRQTSILRHTVDSISSFAWIHLAQDRVQWRSILVNMAVKLWLHKRRVEGGPSV
jgi:hypothetical protein